jgi:hypothetical protein
VKVLLVLTPIFIASADDEFLIFIDTKKLGNNSPRTEYGNQF